MKFPFRYILIVVYYSLQLFAEVKGLFILHYFLLKATNDYDESVSVISSYQERW